MGMLCSFSSSSPSIHCSDFLWEKCCIYAAASVIRIHPVSFTAVKDYSSRSDLLFVLDKGMPASFPQELNMFVGL